VHLLLTLSPVAAKFLMDTVSDYRNEDQTNPAKRKLAVAKEAIEFRNRQEKSLVDHGIKSA
jgi:hypothetical protein